MACVAADDPPEDEDTLPRRLPDNITEATILRPDLSPPMPPVSLVPASIDWPLHRRESGRELPFAPRAPDDVFQTYEAPILSGPGRYLWVALELTGNTRFYSTAAVSACGISSPRSFAPVTQDLLG